MKKHIPNIVTLMNLACGCLGIVFAFESDLQTAAFMVFLGAAFDFADGFVARALGESSELGKQLDSLSDLVTFGVLPAVLLYHVLAYQMLTGEWYQLAPVFIIALAAAYRLGKFNIDTRQTTSFLGLPSPANGIFMASYALAYFGVNNDLNDIVSFLSTPTTIFYAPATIYIIAIVFSLLMVSEIPMFAMKVKGIGWKGNEFRYLLIIGAIPLIILFKFAGVSMAILLYIVLSITENLVRR